MSQVQTIEPETAAPLPAQSQKQEDDPDTVVLQKRCESCEPPANQAVSPPVEDCAAQNN
jgi:cytochrome c551/c552